MERELLLERTKLSQLRLDIDNADGNVATLTKTIMDKSSQLDSSRQRCGELELQVVQLEDQVGGLQGQLRSMQVMSNKEIGFQKLLIFFFSISLPSFFRFNELRVLPNNDSYWMKQMQVRPESLSWKNNWLRSKKQSLFFKLASLPMKLKFGNLNPLEGISRVQRTCIGVRIND